MNNRMVGHGLHHSVLFATGSLLGVQGYGQDEKKKCTGQEHLHGQTL